MKTIKYKFLLVFLAALFFASEAQANYTGADTVNFICKELLGRPADNAVSINMCADSDIEVFVEFGKQKSEYTNNSAVQSCKANEPFNIVVTGLDPNSTYYYRVNYRKSGETDFIARNEHLFKTA